ncbi:hypothetical protein D1AOALGA4SA_6505 [Olavius algarvensis Delta 1 endosymbiont]|nr:hypothetical protein D1AOALGA4SA_6505 [Olavius algarvensis Delta 1 endosymbiont]
MKRAICIGLMVVATIAVSIKVPAISPAVVPSTPAAVEDILYACPFILEKGYAFEWRRERPILTKGSLLVLKVNPDLVYARQALEPVLYVGAQTAERVNNGYRSGYVIAIVPGHIDLTTTPIWFGTPELPERVDDKIIQTELARAKAAAIEPFSAERVAAALTRGVEPLKLTDRDALRPHFVRLLQKYAPDEKDLIDTFNVPVTK